MRTAKATILAMACFAFLCGLSATAFAIRVNVMPDGISNPAIQLNTAYAMPDTVLTIWGNVVDGTSPYQLYFQGRPGACKRLLPMK